MAILEPCQDAPAHGPWISEEIFELFQFGSYRLWIDTTMGCVVSPTQLEKVLSYIDIGKREGAMLAYGGSRPQAAELRNGCFVEPTVFTGVTPGMCIAREEVLGPILSVIQWQDEEQMFEDVNSAEYGLTGSIWTSNLANRIEAAYIWVNKASTHFLGASFGGYKQSGIGREESFEDLLSFTQNKNVHIAF